MSQLVTLNAIPRRANLVACQTGSMKDVVLDSGEYLGISTTNNIDAKGQGIIDAYIVGDGANKVSVLLNDIKSLSPYGVDDEPTDGSSNLVRSKGVYAKIKELEDRITKLEAHHE